MDKNKMSKLDDTDLEEVNGGLVLASRTLYQESIHKTKGKYAVMSGDTEGDPMLLGGQQGGTAGTVRKVNSMNTGTTPGTTGNIKREQFL